MNALRINFDDGKITLVAALNYQCFDMWCRKMGISKEDPRVRYAHTGRDFRGYEPLRVRIVTVCFPDWYVAGKSPHEARDLNYNITLMRTFGTQVFYDECIENPPNQWEREQARRREMQRREQWLAEQRRKAEEGDGRGRE